MYMPLFCSESLMIIAMDNRQISSISYILTGASQNSFRKQDQSFNPWLTWSWNGWLSLLINRYRIQSTLHPFSWWTDCSVKNEGYHRDVLLSNVHTLCMNTRSCVRFDYTFFWYILDAFRIFIKQVKIVTCSRLYFDLEIILLLELIYSTLSLIAMYLSPALSGIL